MRYFLCLFAAFCALLVFKGVALADTASSTSFQIERGVIDVGGGFATSSGFRLDTSLGQPGTGISSSTSFKLRGGFLHFLQPAAAPATTPSSTPTPTPSPNPFPGGFAAGTGFTTPPFLTGEPIPEGIVNACDFNEDSRCNIVDLSILLFYYERIGSGIRRYDLNRNGIVDFPDVSIMMYYWTG